MSKTKITVNSNGSLKIEGDFEIADRNGGIYNLQGREIISICRCGLSQNKPFCDGSHKGHFEHDAVAFDLPPKKEATPAPTIPSATNQGDPVAPAEGKAEDGSKG